MGKISEKQYNDDEKIRLAMNESLLGGKGVLLFTLCDNGTLEYHRDTKKLSYVELVGMLSWIVKIIESTLDNEIYNQDEFQDDD